jgi:hypothetical protein
VVGTLFDSSTGPTVPFFNRVLYSYLKPESARAHPEATVRPWATCQVIGDALSFASALGYVYGALWPIDK